VKQEKLDWLADNPFWSGALPVQLVRFNDHGHRGPLLLA
jgi:hypothetical protein